MSQKKYIVSLSDEERQQLEQLIRTGKYCAQALTRARILLKADITHDKGQYSDQQIATALDVGVATVERVRRRFVEEGLESVLKRRQSSRIYRRLLDGEKEAQLIALACAEAPDGQSHWSLRVLAEKIVELGYVDSISHETVRQALKKTSLSPGCKSAG